MSVHSFLLRPSSPVCMFHAVPCPPALCVAHIFVWLNSESRESGRGARDRNVSKGVGSLPSVHLSPKDPKRLVKRFRNGSVFGRYFMCAFRQTKPLGFYPSPQSNAIKPVHLEIIIEFWSRITNTEHRIVNIEYQITNSSKLQLLIINPII